MLQIQLEHSITPLLGELCQHTFALTYATVVDKCDCLWKLDIELAQNQSDVHIIVYDNPFWQENFSSVVYGRAAETERIFASADNNIFELHRSETDCGTALQKELVHKCKEPISRLLLFIPETSQMIFLAKSKKVFSLNLVTKKFSQKSLIDDFVKIHHHKSRLIITDMQQAIVLNEQLQLCSKKLLFFKKCKQYNHDAALNAEDLTLDIFYLDGTYQPTVERFSLSDYF